MLHLLAVGGFALGLSSITPVLSDHRKDAATLFNNVRTPAALVNGAAVGSAFALQPAINDAVSIAILKRAHTLLAVSVISAECVLGSRY